MIYANKKSLNLKFYGHDGHGSPKPNHQVWIETSCIKAVKKLVLATNSKTTDRWILQTTSLNLSMTLWCNHTIIMIFITIVEFFLPIAFFIIINIIIKNTKNCHIWAEQLCFSISSFRCFHAWRVTESTVSEDKRSFPGLTWSGMCKWTWKVVYIYIYIYIECVHVCIYISMYWFIYLLIYLLIDLSIAYIDICSICIYIYLFQMCIYIYIIYICMYLCVCVCVEVYFPGF